MIPDFVQPDISQLVHRLAQGMQADLGLGGCWREAVCEVLRAGYPVAILLPALHHLESLLALYLQVEPPMQKHMHDPDEHILAVMLFSTVQNSDSLIAVYVLCGKRCQRHAGCNELCMSVKGVK